jgi:hypothetical protein
VSPVLTRPRPQAAPARLGRDLTMVAFGGLLALGVILGVSAAVEGPSYVDRLTIRNATPYLVEVEVTSGDREGWLDLGPVSAGERHDFADVIDKGDRWAVRLSSAGTDGGELVMSRDELERGGWVVTISDQVSARLAANGATPPTPRR